MSKVLRENKTTIPSQHLDTSLSVSALLVSANIEFKVSIEMSHVSIEVFGMSFN